MPNTGALMVADSPVGPNGWESTKSLREVGEDRRPTDALKSLKLSATKVRGDLVIGWRHRYTIITVN